jgi:hypothetical protein
LSEAGRTMTAKPIQRRHIVFMLGAGLVAPATPARAHGGGRDKLGCHHDRKNGGYHCHTGKLAGQAFPSKEAAKKALQGDQ